MSSSVNWSIVMVFLLFMFGCVFVKMFCVVVAVVSGSGVCFSCFASACMLVYGCGRVDGVFDLMRNSLYFCL